MTDKEKAAIRTGYDAYYAHMGYERWKK